MPFGINFGSKSQKTSSQSSGRSFVDPTQAPFLDFLRNAASGFYTASGGAPAASGVAQGLATGIIDQSQNIISGLQGAGSQFQNFGDPNQVNRQIGQLETQLGDFYNEQLLPGMRRDAGSVGQLGMSRDMVNREQGAGVIADAFASGVTDIYGQAQQQRLQAAQGQAAAQQAAAQTQLGALSNLYNIGTAPFMTAFAPLLALSEVFGAPTLLQEQQSSSRGKSSSFNFGLENVG